MNDTNIQSQIDGLKKRIVILEEALGKTGSTDIPTPKKLSFREFLISKKPSDDVKRTLTIGYFFEKYEGYSSFNSDDLMGAYEKAKEKKPLNIHDKVNMNIRNGYMAESTEKKDNKKAWYTTNSGTDFVENNFKTSK